MLNYLLLSKLDTCFDGIRHFIASTLDTSAIQVSINWPHKRYGKRYSELL